MYPHYLAEEVLECIKAHLADKVYNLEVVVQGLVRVSQYRAKLIVCLPAQLLCLTQTAV